MIPSNKVKIRNSYIYNKDVKDDIKIASVSDIHLSSSVGLNDVNNISQVLYDEDPNYICILGDIVDSPEELMKGIKVDELMKLIKNTSSIAPTFIILGSHDYLDDSKEPYVDVLDNTFVWKHINEIDNCYVLNDNIYEDNNLFIGGYRQKKDTYLNLKDQHIEDYVAFNKDFRKHHILYKNLPTDKPRILLTHSPEVINNLAVQDTIKYYDVILTGHYHNGCVPAILDSIYPKNAGIITPRGKFFPKNARGIIRLDNGAHLIYNGGWVKIQDCAPKVLQPLDKLCNRQMDITTLTGDKSISDIKIKSKKRTLSK